MYGNIEGCIYIDMSDSLGRYTSGRSEDLLLYQVLLGDMSSTG